MKIYRALTPLIIIVIVIGLHLYSSSNDEKNTVDRADLEKNGVLDVLPLNSNSYRYYTLTNDSHVPTIDRIDGKTLILSIYDKKSNTIIEGIEWEPGTKPLAPYKYDAIGIKLPESYSGNKKYILITEKKVL